MGGFRNPYGFVALGSRGIENLHELPPAQGAQVAAYKPNDDINRTSFMTRRSATAVRFAPLPATRRVNSLPGLRPRPP